MKRIVLSSLCIAALLSTTTDLLAQPGGAQQFLVTPGGGNGDFGPGPGPGRPPQTVHDSFLNSTQAVGLVGEVTRQGLLVDFVIPGTEAERVGMIEGDVILKADRMRIRHEHDWEDALHHAGRFMSLTVLHPCGRVVRMDLQLSSCNFQHRHQPAEPVRREVRFEPVHRPASPVCRPAPPVHRPAPPVYRPAPPRGGCSKAPVHRPSVQPRLNAGGGGTQIRLGNSGIRVGINF